MEKITLIKCDDGAIWVTTEEDQNGREYDLETLGDIGKQMLWALASFLGYEPAELLNFDEDEDNDYDEVTDDYETMDPEEFLKKYL